VEIVAGFGDYPMRDDHYASDFPAWLDRVIASARRIEYDHERPTPRRPYEMTHA
jgi:hypothetical protein